MLTPLGGFDPLLAHTQYNSCKHNLSAFYTLCNLLPWLLFSKLPVVSSAAAEVCAPGSVGSNLLALGTSVSLTVGGTPPAPASAVGVPSSDSNFTQIWQPFL